VLSLAHDGLVTAANARSQMVLGRGEADLVGRPLADFVAAEDGERLRELVRVAFDGSDVFQFDTRTDRPDGRSAYLTVNLAPLRASRGAPISGVSVIIQDITRRKRMELELRHQAERDPLTGLYNRRRFEDELHRATRLAERHGHHGALLLLDIDDFKAVNDSWGHPTGDELLRALARVLDGSSRDSDIPARLGGDEFALLLPLVEGPGAGPAAAAKLGDAVRAALATWAATTSIGVASFGPPNAVDAELVLAIADEALYRAKTDKDSRRAAAPVPSPAADGRRQSRP
jgi:diguanylate cyclase (GGDEF)-like protein/PAS domain S-box-containing protein